MGHPAKLASREAGDAGAKLKSHTIFRVFL